MNVGLDVGYSATKAVSNGGKVIFPSLVGSPERPRFGLGVGETRIMVIPEHVQVGEGAIAQSRYARRREDRNWINGAEWYALALAANRLLT